MFSACNINRINNKVSATQNSNEMHCYQVIIVVNQGSGKSDQRNSIGVD